MSLFAVLTVAVSSDVAMTCLGYQAGLRADANRPTVHQALGGVYAWVQAQQRRDGQPVMADLPRDYYPARSADRHP